MRILVIGAGAWGTALAMHAAARHTVQLWARDAQQAKRMQQTRENHRYLPGIHFPAGLQAVCGDIQHCVQSADLLVLGTPMAALRSGLAMLRDCKVKVPVVWLSKGFEALANDAAAHSHGLLGNEVCAAVAPQLLAGVLSGPSFAQEVARHQPTALVAASVHAQVRDTLVSAFHGDNLRVYANDDITGVEVGGAVKNVLAIATGLCDGLGLGMNARAALITRGLAEMTRLGLALGAQADTFMGLSGLGDLVLTATGDLSRNRQIGLLLAQGQSLQDAVQSLGHVAEGVYSAHTVLQRAQKLGVQMPITETVVALLGASMPVRDAVQVLMGREPRPE